ncbi:MAG: phenylacetate-CoA oxygenase subunit PaaI [Cytophagales bacterium]|nr:MAG: phenylacetate-CoA oxygenase subunit PaaI [Cytophagales bacterium]
MSLSISEHLFEYCLRLGDTSLILGHRLSEWCGHGPLLEEDIAMTNIALDHVGQATSLLHYAAQLEGKGRDEDTLAFFRDVAEFRNVLLVEQPNGDFACTMLRQFFVDAFNFHLYQLLKESKDATLSAIAIKSHKEISYHLRHSSEWVVRLGDGTVESKKRLENAVQELWMYTGELFEMTQTDQALIEANIAFSLDEVKPLWQKQVQETFERAKLKLPNFNDWMATGSRKGIHSEHLGYLLAEMQVIPRANPDAKW